MRIEFFYKETGKEINPDMVFGDDYFVMQDKVYRNNQQYFESQPGCVGFFDFIMECPHVGWRVVDI